MPLNPYDICVIFGDEESCCHLVYAVNENEAMSAIMVFYKDSTVTGIVFGTGE